MKPKMNGGVKSSERIEPEAAADEKLPEHFPGQWHGHVVDDYRVAFRSRVASLLGRREVSTGRAKFGIFGDGKEVPQVVLAKVFRKGDWRAGYYRDQTLMFATGMLTVREFFAQLYADCTVAREPASGGRLMNNHFGTRFLDDDGNWKSQLAVMNSSADISAVGPQMAWMLGLAYASKLYREVEALTEVAADFSRKGEEVVFGTIGDAATSEGVFFEAINAAGVLQVPLVVSVWDDGYGISVPSQLQTAKGSISEVLKGFQRDASCTGIDLYKAEGWDYQALCEVYRAAAQRARRDHVPALIHVVGLTQPQGHSTSGSHTRYKSRERLAWEQEHDCLAQMRRWIIDQGIIREGDLDELENEERTFIEGERRAALDALLEDLDSEREPALALIDRCATELSSGELVDIAAGLRDPHKLNRKLIQSSMLNALTALGGMSSAPSDELRRLFAEYRTRNARRYRSHLYSESPDSPLHVTEEAPVYSEDSQEVDGREVLVRYFDHQFKSNPRVIAIGQDVGKLGDVNLVFEGLQEKYGEWRLTDTGIREATIIGQGIGAAMRGLRPIVDIQYLDYFIWALEQASDVLASLHHRTAGGQKAPVIIRTKGHRLMGMWHAGSPIATILHSCRGIYLCVPRDMTRAAGLYNTLLRGDNPGIVIEVLSGYRIKERVPDNIDTFSVPLGVTEVLRSGGDVTVVTYGAMCRIALEAADRLESLGIDVEVIDVQTLNPFDKNHSIVESIKRTNAVVFLDEDVPGGASAFMMQHVLEVQEGWGYLDAPPTTLTSSECRPSYATDGDYFSKPSQEDIVMAVYEMMRERQPGDFPPLW